MESFRELGLPVLLERALDEIQFTQPTPIQQKAIPLLMQGKDLIAQAETGSGKTAAFVIPILAQLIEDPKANALILSPTRELSQQIGQFVSQLTNFFKPFHSVNLVGGSDIRKQFKALQRKPRIIIATPGRLIDHLKRNTVQIHKLKHLVLDEGDRMIDMGFAPQLQEILKYIPEERQTCFFTATLNKKVTELCQQYLNKPERLLLDKSTRPVVQLRQAVLKVTPKEKAERLLEEVTKRTGSIIIFMKTKSSTDKISKYLEDYGLKVGLIHGDRSQGQRNQALTGFRNGKTRILCATDVASRGLDVPSVEHVINFDLPMQDEDFVHRVGRTARNGAEGEALSFVTPNEIRHWNRMVSKFKMAEPLMLKEERGARSESRGPRWESRGGGGRSRPERSERPARSGKPAWGERSERSSRPERGERPARSAKPAWGERSERSARPERSERPVRSAKPAWGERSERSARPERSERPARSAKPAWGERSERSARPERSERPARSAKPAWGERSERSEGASRSFKKTGNPFHKKKDAKAARPHAR